MSDQDLARLTSVNLLVAGPDDAVAKLVTSLWLDLAAPIVVRHRGERLRLSPPFEPVGTMVIHGLDTLTRQEQHALRHWMSAGHGRTRIVSTAPESLLPMLEAGLFDDELYYSLNLVTLDLDMPVAL